MNSPSQKPTSPMIHVVMTKPNLIQQTIAGHLTKIHFGLRLRLYDAVAWRRSQADLAKYCPKKKDDAWDVPGGDPDA